MKQSNYRGLTLLEVLIAMTIFSTITVFSAQALRQALFNKSKIQNQLDEMSRVRDALTIIRKDLELCVHYLDFEFEFNDAVKNQARNQIQKAMTPTQTPQPSQPGQPPPPIPSQQRTGQQVNLQQKLQELEQRFVTHNAIRLSPATHFRGLEDKVFFVTSNVLSSPNQKKAFSMPLYMMRVSYQVKPCPTNSSINCLVRFSDSITDGDLENISNGVVVLEGVSDFSLRYLGARQQDWVSNWDSRQENAAQKNLYPEAVEISLTRTSGEGQNQKKISMQAVTYLHFPNNPKEPDQSSRQKRGFTE
jgi:prepilin-type N-terminal cleavage/methylation domain-containing protein